MNGVRWNETSVQSRLSYLGGPTAGNASFSVQDGVAPMNPLLMAADQIGDGSAMQLLSFTGVHLHEVFSNNCNKPSVSPGPTNAVPPVHMETFTTLPCASIEIVKGIPQLQPGVIGGDSELPTDSGFKQLYSYLNLSLEESAANITCKLDLNTSETTENSLTVLDRDQNGMKLASTEDPSNGGHSTICQSCYAVTFTDPAKSPEFHGLHGAISSHASTSKSSMNHRMRRSRIAKAVKELRGLVPKSRKCGRESVLGDAIEYVKLLKLQLQAYLALIPSITLNPSKSSDRANKYVFEFANHHSMQKAKDLPYLDHFKSMWRQELHQLLSQSRLGGETTSDPFINIEGHGHYLLRDHMVGEPLEELMGQLMETNTAAASHLLERKGLYVIPMALAHDLLQTE